MDSDSGCGSGAFSRIVLFHAALVTLCSRSEHGPRELVAWADTSSDVFSKSKSQGAPTPAQRRSAGPWRRELF